MKIGVVFPQTEIGNDPIAIRDYAQAAEGLGYTHLMAYDHVLGADPKRPGGWSGPYTSEHPFHEPFVLFGYLAGLTQQLELATGILILPQRQTVLVAKQAAEVDILTHGRLRLGVGVGWNPVEYEALGKDFHNRGRRIEEQIEVLRTLWTQDIVTFERRWHRITKARLNPPPPQRPIPIWIGGGAESVLRRVARLGDGWFTPYRFRPSDEARATIERLRDYLRQADRDLAQFGIEGGIEIRDGSPDDWAREVEAWRDLGGTHLHVNTMKAGLVSPDDHINAIRQFKEAVSESEDRC